MAEFPQKPVWLWQCLLVGLFPVLLVGCAASKGMMLNRMQDQFEAAGQAVAQAQHCNLPVDVDGLSRQLGQYAAAHGSNADEQKSLVSYFQAAIETEGRNLASAPPCAPAEKDKASQVLFETLSSLR